MNRAILWVLQRVSAILLIGLLVVNFLLLSYSDPGTNIYLFLSVDSILLAAVLFHGLYGLHNILVDYGVKSRTRSIGTVILGGTGLVLFVSGIYSLYQFI